MSEKKKNFMILILVIAIVVFIVCIGVLAAIYGREKIANNINNSQNNNYAIINEGQVKNIAKNNIIEEGILELPKDETNGELVLTIYHQILVDTATFPNTVITVDVPAINLDFENVKKINKQIYNTYVNMVKQEEKTIEEGYSASLLYIKYQYYLNDNILSLVIVHAVPAAGAQSFEIYNINVETGECVTNEEILAKKGISTERYEEKLKTVYEEAFTENNKGAMNDEYFLSIIDFYQSAKALTISNQNCNANVPMFLDQDGTINVAAYIYSVTGGQGYNHILKVQ